MLITLQFPISDARVLLPESGRLDRPSWPWPIEGDEFVRSFGGVKARKRGGLTNWVGEALHCEDSSALKFTSPLAHVLPSGMPLKVAFRRLYSDGMILAKYEIGFALPSESVESGRLDIAAFSEAICRIPVSILGGGQIELATAGKSLAAAYGKSTAAQNSNAAEMAMVRAGKPVMLWESKKPLGLPRHYKLLLKDEEKICTNLGTIRSAAGTMGVWFLQPQEVNSMLRKDQYESIRKLRLCILRLHAEYQCLQQTLSSSFNAKMAAMSAESDALQTFFNRAITRITGLESSTESAFDNAILAKAILVQSFESPSRISAILGRLHALNLRGNIMRKIDQKITYINNVNNDFSNSNIKGPVIVGNQNTKFRDVVTNISEVEKEIGLLGEEIRKISSQLPNEAREAISKYLEELQAGLESPQADKRWWEVSLKGIKEAASTVASISGPVIKVVEKLWDMLA